MRPIPAFYRLISCLIAGLATAFFFSRLGARFLIAWLPQPVVLSISAILFLTAVGYGIFWAFQKRNDGNRFSAPGSTSTLAFWQGIARYAIAIDLIMIALQGFYQLLFFVHLGSLDLPFSSLGGEELTWAYFGHYNHGFVYFIGFIQILGALLLLFNRTKLAGVFVLLPVMLAIVVINYFFDMERAETLQAIELLISLIYLLLTERKRLWDFFFQQPPSVSATPLKSGLLKNALRVCAILVPLALILHYGSPDTTPSLTGSYQVSQFVVNDQEKKNPVCTDSVLTRVYMDLGNFCVFEFNDQQRRLFGHYQLSEDHKKITIAWYYPQNVHDTLIGEIGMEPTGVQKKPDSESEAISRSSKIYSGGVNAINGSKIFFNGKMGKDSVGFILAKRK